MSAAGRAGDAVGAGVLLEPALVDVLGRGVGVRAVEEHHLAGELGLLQDAEQVFLRAAGLGEDDGLLLQGGAALAPAVPRRRRRSRGAGRSAALRPWSSWRWTWPGRGTRGAWPFPAASRRAARACSAGRSGSPSASSSGSHSSASSSISSQLSASCFRRGVHGFAAWAAAVSSLKARPLERVGNGVGG